ncbi:hypothetical protein COL154_012884 [Colletotrichum chrysophilum]|nr:hypothetical protein COL154_012884 [Colletotrichum chrysophilum]
MAVMYPLPSAFVQWTNKFVDPAAGFALGWCYWFNYWIAVANELQGIVTVLSFWNTSVPKAAWISIFWVVIALINVGAVTVFAEVEVVMAAIKFGWIFVVIIASIVISAGGAPNHEAIGFRYWNEAPFLNGFRGFLTVMPVCIFALSGSETTGLVAAELSNPKKAVPKAVKSIALRLAMFYLMGSLMITITVSPSDSNLFGSGAHATDASPFVIAFRNAGLEPLAHMMNAVIFLSVLSSGSINAYAGSRTLVGLSEIGMAPSVSPAVLQLINLLVLLPALVSAAHGDPRRMSYSGSCIIAKDGTWSPKCTTAYVEAALGSQCTNLGGTLSNINFQTTITQINYRCNCVHGNTKDFTFNDGVFEAKAVVGDKC